MWQLKLLQENIANLERLINKNVPCTSSYKEDDAPNLLDFVRKLPLN